MQTFVWKLSTLACPQGFRPKPGVLKTRTTKVLTCKGGGGGGAGAAQGAAVG